MKDITIFVLAEKWLKTQGPIKDFCFKTLFKQKFLTDTLKMNNLMKKIGNTEKTISA